MPILVLSAVGEEDGQGAALDAGADDYVTKPFGPRELIARLEAASGAPGRTARRARHPRTERSRSTSPPVVRRDGAEVHLTPTEFDLLRTLMSNRGRLMTHGTLLTQVWGPHTPTTSRPFAPTWPTSAARSSPTARQRHIRTEAGIGYRFVD